jgi:signal transduction histidine kinase/ActR/RegA family two-component response regulator
MSSALNSGSGSDNDRLKRCIRDLAALNALPSLCIGRTPSEALDAVVDALPTALDCELLYLLLPGEPPRERASFKRAALSAAQLEEVRALTALSVNGAAAQVSFADDALWCMDAEIPIGARRGRLVAGSSSPAIEETQRVLLRTAANIVGTILESAHVLEVARRKDDFLAMLGHELRNPLAAIVTASELMKLRGTGGRERDAIERQTGCLIRLVDDLLDISRVTRGHIELRSEPVRLSSVLENAVELALPLVTRHQQLLRVESPGDTTLLGDPVRLAQIFGNLLTNAAKFTPPGGRIDVSMGARAGRVRVIIRDNGCGIAPDQLERIFEPFVQADRARDVLRGGLGLGLAIVSNLVRLHGGSISVHSAGRGLGAEFSVELPTTTAVRSLEKPARQQAPPARTAVRVLVVDDNTDLADLLCEALQGEGFQTEAANSGNAALTSWRTFLPHAAVLDVGLPDLDGYEVAQALRAEHGRHATLIAVTGFGRSTDRIRAVDAGFDHHLVKPVNIEELVRVLDERVVSRSA